MLQEQADSLQKEHSDWLAQVQADLKRNSEERASERVEQAAKVQELKEQLQQQSKVSALLPLPVQMISVKIFPPDVRPLLYSVSWLCHNHSPDLILLLLVIQVDFPFTFKH